MSAEIQIDLTLPEGLLQELDVLGDPANQRTLVEAAAMGVEVALRDHFASLQTRPRKDGLQSQGFWSGTDGNSVAEQISGHTLADTHAQVIIDSPELRYKLTGGTIRAADYGKRWLTIPATNEAAASPTGARGFQARVEWREHPDGGVRPALVAGADYMRRAPGERRGRRTRDPQRANAGAGDVLYWLIEQATHQAMPEAMPQQTTLDDAARDAAADALDALLAGAAA